jgi:hypothetical protein
VSEIICTPELIADIYYIISYVEAYNTIRGITGVGEGNGPYISIHDGFRGLPTWAGFMAGADRLSLDMHPYFAFSAQTTIDPIDTGTGAAAGGIWPARACNSWAASMNTRFGRSLLLRRHNSLYLQSCQFWNYICWRI